MSVFGNFCSRTHLPGFKLRLEQKLVDKSLKYFTKPSSNNVFFSFIFHPVSPNKVSHHSENFLEVVGEAGSFIKSLRHSQNFEKTFPIENAELGYQR